MLRYWQWLNEREPRVAHYDIETLEILTCYQIGLNRQSHYAHKDVTAEVAIFSPEPSQLSHRMINFQ